MLQHFPQSDIWISWERLEKPAGTEYMRNRKQPDGAERKTGWKRTHAMKH